VRAKLTRLEGERIVFLPFPYWNVDSRTVSVNEINSIHVLNKKSSVGRGVLSGVGWTACIFGFLGLVSSEYDEDYRGLLWAAPLGGVIIGAPIGLLIEAMASTPSPYYFTKMNPNEKYAVLRRIMGL
jgi:hypothetical protein